MEEPIVQLRLGDWADLCGHPAAAGLPRLWVTLTFPGRDRWANVALHWSGKDWHTCVEATWEFDGGPSSSELGWLADRVRVEANPVDHEHWVEQYRTNLSDSLSHARSKLAWDELRRERRHDEIRQLDAAALADVADGRLSQIASGLLPTWNGAAEAPLDVAASILSDAAPLPSPTRRA